MRDLTPEEQAQLESMTDPEVIKPKFVWDDTFQRKLLAMLLTDDFMLIQSMDKVKPEYFTNESHVLICRILLNYFTKEKHRPQDWIISQELTSALKEIGRAHV